jgi:alpha-D-ribose 1-methylphosphonate 5-triphosphate synthase subunit PhnH
MVRETAFDDVFDSQTTFRALLEAMSRPGRVAQAPVLRYAGAPVGMTPHVMTVLKSLCDHRVVFSVAGSELRREWEGYLAMNCASPFSSPDKADYVLFDGMEYDDAFGALRIGSLEFPEASATAILSVSRLATEAGQTERACQLRFSGPGVKGIACIHVTGLHRRYPEERCRATGQFPLGIDLLLVDAEARIVGVPRTTHLEMG